MRIRFSKNNLLFVVIRWHQSVDGNTRSGRLHQPTIGDQSGFEVSCHQTQLPRYCWDVVRELILEIFLTGFKTSSNLIFIRFLDLQLWSLTEWFSHFYPNNSKYFYRSWPEMNAPRIETDCSLVLKYISTSTSTTTTAVHPQLHNNKLSEVERGLMILFSLGWRSIFSTREGRGGRGLFW